MSEASAQVAVRATGNHVTDEVVEFIAGQAKPTRYERADFADPESLTYRTVIERKCGSVSPRYVESFKAGNNFQTLELDAHIDGDIAGLVWPACLKWITFGDENPLEYIVRPNDNAVDIRKRFTGVDAVDSLKYFLERPEQNQRKSFNELGEEDFKHLEIDERILIKHATFPVILEPVDGVDNETFVEGLKAAGNRDPSTSPDEIGVYASTEKYKDQIKIEKEVYKVSPGSIVMGDTTSSDGKAYCKDGFSPSAPFSAELVADMIKHTRSRRLASGEQSVTANALVIDNGFLGVQCADKRFCPEFDANDHVKLASPFDAEFFDEEKWKTEYGLGPAAMDSNGFPIEPILFSSLRRKNKKIEVDKYMQHGTHVTGLVLGGPHFKSHRAALKTAAGISNLRVSVANVADGEKNVLPQASEILGTLVNTTKQKAKPFVINLSLQFDADIPVELQNNIVTFIKHDNKDTLFIAAAGNNYHEDLSSKRHYPATLGGSVAENVVTVAAHNAKNKITEFSNIGASVVDIAAPGCEIDSWINASDQTQPFSGTSQAAPLVTFGAAVLKSLTDWGPLEVKNRLNYTVDLFDETEHRNFVRSMGMLNFEKLLAPYDDYIEVFLTRNIDGSPITEFQTIKMLGELEQVFFEVKCKTPDGRTNTIRWEKIYSLKRKIDDHKVLVYYDDGPSEPIVQICELSITLIDTIKPVKFKPRAVIADGRLITDPQTIAQNILRFSVSKDDPHLPFLQLNEYVSGEK